MSEAGGAGKFLCGWLKMYTLCLRRALLRLRVQKERVTDDEEEGNHLQNMAARAGFVPLCNDALMTPISYTAAGDDISYTGLHPKLIWERSMTLGRGNDRCDFCMKVR